MSDTKGSTSTITDFHALHKELDEASCPICMDHPHNAVLLLCSSHDKGCKPFICDTSYRHSNCLDRYKTLRVNNRTSQSTHRFDVPTNPDTDNQNSYEQVENQHGSIEQTGSASTQERNGLAEFRVGNISSQEANLNLTCPMCRGTVIGWKIVREARQYLDLKKRSCSQESCSFIGNYRELRRHARTAHPTICPADVDPSRERAWRRLEHEREHGDIMSAIRSAMPGAVVFGDYVIDNGDGADNESNEIGETGQWLTTFLLFQMIGRNSPRRMLSQTRGSSRAWTRHRRSSGSFSSRRNLWGQNFQRSQDEEEDWADSSSRPRRRRRFSHSRSNENQR